MPRLVLHFAPFGNSFSLRFPHRFFEHFGSSDDSQLVHYKPVRRGVFGRLVLSSSIFIGRFCIVIIAPNSHALLFFDAR